MKPLKPYRQEIDDIDNQILALLERRFQIVREVGQIKTDHQIDIVQHDRVKEVLDRVTDLANEKNIPRDLIYNFYKNMIDHAHRIEAEIQNNLNKKQAGNG